MFFYMYWYIYFLFLIDEKDKLMKIKNSMEVMFKKIKDKFDVLIVGGEKK